jgi:cytochrome c oxidase assembly factor 2
MTSSLFATTVLASFFVVALPHVLPCPAPRRAYADGEMPADAAACVKRKRKRRLDGEDQGPGVGIVQFGQGEEGQAGRVDGIGNENAEGLTRVKAASKRRECPVPKPGGMLGEWLGFNGTRETGEGKTRPDR